MGSTRETVRVQRAFGRAKQTMLELERVRDYNSTSLSWPVATNLRQSVRHRCMFAVIFLSLITFSIQSRRTLSSSGTKYEERRDRMVSNVAELDVM